MNQAFDSFEFQLNLGGNTQANQKRLISVIITPQTDVQQVAQNICAQYNIGQSLIDVVADTIYGEIKNQIIEKQKKRAVSRNKSPGINFENSSRQNSQKTNPPYQKSSSPHVNNKTKKFKNRFCSYLKQSPAKPAAKVNCNDNKILKQSNTTIKLSDVETFRNGEHFIDPSTISVFDEEYSFRPSCIETVDLTNNSFQKSMEFTESLITSISRCSYQTNHQSKNGKKSQISIDKLLKTKKQRTVFDNLYQHSILLNKKKQMDRKKSFEKLTFKPQLNQMSMKIVEKKMLNNPELSKSQKNIYLKTKVDPLLITKSKCQQKSLSKSKCINKENFTSHKQVSGLKNTQKIISIYERGVLFKKKSQDKLSRMKEKQFYDEIKSCSFQPTFFSKKSPSKSRII